MLETFALAYIATGAIFAFVGTFASLVHQDRENERWARRVRRSR